MIPILGRLGRRMMGMRLLRSLSWRLGRKLYCAARMEYANAPDCNGEYWLLGQILSYRDKGAPLLLDIGANRGEWTAQASAIMDRRGIDGRILAFEPSAATFEYLGKRFEGARRVALHRLAVTDHAGEAEFFVVGNLAGTNSLHGSAGAIPEKVACVRLDDFATQQQIDRIAFVKSDTEGYDMKVLLGADRLLREGRIEVWQFEYNHRWAFARHFLKDVFDYVSDKPYRIGKLYGNGIETYDVWHPELDRFFEDNYVLIRNGSELEHLCRRVGFDSSNVAVSMGG